MSEELIPNDGRAIDINSPTAKSIIEGVIPKAIRTWTIFRNTNNTLEGIESVTFAMWQVALDEIEKESDHIVFMSDTTINLIRSNIKRLQIENEELKKEINLYENSIVANHDRAIGKRLEEVLEENEELKKIIETQNPWYNCKNCNKDYRQALEEIREMCSNTCEKNKDCIHSCYECKSIDEPVAINRILNKINEVLK